MPATYELRTGTDGREVFKCLFCGVESGDRANLERRYCDACHWFHEPLNEDAEEYSRHLYTAVQEARCALELAEAAGEDAKKVEFLKSALRQLRKALGRV